MPHLTPHAIAIQEEARQARTIAELAAVAEPIGGGWMCFEREGAWCNQAAGMGLSGPVSEKDLDRLVEFYVSRGVEPRMELCPFAHTSLVRGLADRGFVLREFENLLVRELSPDEDMRAAIPHGWPDGLELKQIDAADTERVNTFVDVATSGFGTDLGPVPETFIEICRRLISRPGISSFLALVNGEPAGGGQLGVSDDAGSLFGTSVVPEFRRRGVQAALIARRLEHARDQGCKLATIGSRPGIATERNAARLGFYVAYTKVIMVMPGEGLSSSP
jgi:GNAT superfamily N-acetyltransferase